MTSSSAPDVYLDACAARAERPLEAIASALRDSRVFRLSGLTLVRPAHRAPQSMPLLACSHSHSHRLLQTEGALACLLEGLASAPSLTEVGIAELQLSASSAGDLVRALCRCSSVTHLSMSACSVGDDGMGELLVNLMPHPPDPLHSAHSRHLTGCCTCCAATCALALHAHTLIGWDHELGRGLARRGAGRELWPPPPRPAVESYQGPGLCRPRGGDPGQWQPVRGEPGLQ